MKKFILISVTLVVSNLSGCAFNKPTEASKNVLLVKEYNVKACQKLGSTTAKVKDSIAGVKLPDSQIAKELINIAKNDAAAMGGDSIIEISPIKGGFQVFGIYKCQPE